MLHDEHHELTLIADGRINPARELLGMGSDRGEVELNMRRIKSEI
jgi:hypothetical protein